MQFTEEDITPMSLGARVLGGGGAGDPYLGTVMLRHALAGGRHIDIVALNDLPAEAEVAPFALIGSPHAMAEKLLSTADMRTLFAGVSLRDRQPDALMAYELGGLNALYPLAAAAELGVPFLDADFVGRGFPSLDSTMLGIDDAHPSAHIICDTRGRTVTIKTTGLLSMESLIRPMVETVGWLAAISTSSLDRPFLLKHSLSGTVTRCIELGRMFGEFPDHSLAEVETTLAASGGALLGSGRVIERVSNPDRLGPRASLTIEADDPAMPALRVEQRNEFHVVARDGVIVASVPDIIVVVDRYTWEPLQTDEVATERDVHVIAVPAHDRWYEPKALELGGPRAFGYGIDHVSFTVWAGGVDSD